MLEGAGSGGVGGRSLGLVPGAVVGGGLLGGALLGGGHVVADLPGALDMGAEAGTHRVALGHGDGALRLIGAGVDRVGVGQRGVATRARLLGLAADHAGVALPCLVTAVGHPSVVAVHRDLLSVVHLVSGRGPAQTPGTALTGSRGNGWGRPAARAGAGRRPRWSRPRPAPAARGPAAPAAPRPPAGSAPRRPCEQITLTSPVSSSRLRKVIPLAVAGRCRCVTTPPTSTRGRAGPRTALRRRPRRARRAVRGRTGSGGCRGDTPVAHTSATASSTAVIPGSGGASAPTTMPGSRSGRSWATAPAAHSASRRVSPKRAERPRGRQRLQLPVPSARSAGPGRPCPVRPPRRDPLGQLLSQRPDRREPEPDRPALQGAAARAPRAPRRPAPGWRWRRRG